MEGWQDMKEWKKRGIQVILLLAFFVTLAVLYENGDKESASKTVFAMDTYMELTAYGRNREQALEAAVQEIERLDALLSTGSEESEVSRLNRTKQGILSEDTKYLYQRSMELYESTKGAFDITIYPIMRLWGFTDGNWHVPTNEELEQFLPVDAGALQLEEDSLTLPEAVEIDFGGIAKGYTTARLAQIMADYGVKHANLNLGGNVQVIGSKIDGSPWRIAIRHPLDISTYLGVLEVENQAVITSGGYERYFEEHGVRYHHLIDPHTGRPAQSGLISVTIISEDATLADGLSTALYVLGLEEATSYWQAHSADFDAVMMTEEGKLYVTQGVADKLQTNLEYEMISR